MTNSDTTFQQLSTPGDLTPELRRSLVDCWVEVSNAGGAAGFPFLPVDPEVVDAAADRIGRSLDPQHSRLLLVHVGDSLVGWMNLRRSNDLLTAHWGTVHHVQTRPAVRGQGLGASLMHRAREIARDEMGLEQLHLAARGGVGLEGFYGRLGWKEIGRWPGALRLTPGDDRDEVLMLLAPL
ncbi:GNAT family N-acetyltransferase [Streptomyces sp. NBC_00378]|uniref:GNAT family N-acetyltransferase n=1 Tax=unclassified Streptomyces TaxID=2593676 RepID=UPI00224D5CCC|nr:MULTISPECIES: GNAT family N-acetyltransferase [unclassified Streptomyces]MCX5115287.1 GNAT family N-acetyltransferase [Streptomyces sp. NBC_00378]